MTSVVDWELKAGDLKCCCLRRVADSPFRVRVNNPVDASKVKCFGPGLDTKGVPAGAPATFTVDTRDAGEAPLQVTYTDQTGQFDPTFLWSSLVLLL